MVCRCCRRARRNKETGAQWVWPSQQCPRGRGYEGLRRTRAPSHRSLDLTVVPLGPKLPTAVAPPRPFRCKYQVTVGKIRN